MITLDSFDPKVSAAGCAASWSGNDTEEEIHIIRCVMQSGKVSLTVVTCSVDSHNKLEFNGTCKDIAEFHRILERTFHAWLCGKAVPTSGEIAKNRGTVEGMMEYYTLE